MCEHLDGWPLFTGPQEERQARKDHQCGECGSIIPKGARYYYRCGKWQPDVGSAYFWNTRTCLQCEEDWTEFCSILGQAEQSMCCIQHGELATRISEALDYGWIEENHPLVQRWFPEEEPTPEYENLEINGQLRLPRLALA